MLNKRGRGHWRRFKISGASSLSTHLNCRTAKALGPRNAAMLRGRVDGSRSNDVAFWHSSDMPASPHDVRSRGQGGLPSCASGPFLTRTGNQ